MYPSAEGAQIDCRGLVRIYSSDETEVVALQGLDLAIESGEIVTVVGASGSGKSTLLNILAGLDKPSAGQVLVAGHDLLAMTNAQRLDYRRHTVGFLWQKTSRNLLPYLSAFDNVMLPLTVVRASRSTRRVRATEMLELVGMADRLDDPPDQLSGGEQQRVAIAIALVNRPKLLLADEPTGELDVETAAEVLAVLRNTSLELGTTTIIVTHDDQAARSGHRSISIRDGRVSSERRVDQRTGQFEEERTVLDAAGRLQLPDAQVRAAGLGRLVRVDQHDEHLRVERDQP